MFILSLGMYLPSTRVTLISGLKVLSIPESRLSKPLNTDNINIRAAVPMDIPMTDIHVMILMALVVFLPKRYLEAIERINFMGAKIGD